MANKGHEYERGTTTSRLQCTCKDAYQDERYGKQVRVHNRRKDDGKIPMYRCCTCSAERSKKNP